jgi:hypothetical protein
MAPPATVGISSSSLNHAFRDPPPTEAPVSIPVQEPVAVEEPVVSQEPAAKEETTTAPEAAAVQEPTKFVKAAEGPTKYSETFISGPKNFKADIEIKGSETQPAAKYKHYLPTWDATKSKQNLLSLRSTSFNSLLQNMLHCNHSSTRSMERMPILHSPTC